MSSHNHSILVVLHNTKQELNAVKHGLELSEIFKASLSVALLKDNHNSNSIAIVRDEIHKLNQHKNTAANIFLIKGRVSELNNCVKKTEPFFMVFEINKKGRFSGFKHRKVLNLIRNVKTPSIVVQKDTPVKNCYKKIFIPVYHKKECKELMIWASYFGRFYNAKLFLMSAKEKSQTSIKIINSIFVFSNNLFRKFSFDYEFINGTEKSRGIVNETFKKASEKSTGVVAVLADKQQNFIDIFLNPSEIKAIFNKQKLPVILVNPLKKYYLPCK